MDYKNRVKLRLLHRYKLSGKQIKELFKNTFFSQKSLAIIAKVCLINFKIEKYCTVSKNSNS